LGIKQDKLKSPMSLQGSRVRSAPKNLLHRWAEEEAAAALLLFAIFYSFFFRFRIE